MRGKGECKSVRTSSGDALPPEAAANLSSHFFSPPVSRIKSLRPCNFKDHQYSELRKSVVSTKVPKNVTKKIGMASGLSRLMNCRAPLVVKAEKTSV